MTTKMGTAGNDLLTGTAANHLLAGFRRQRHRWWAVRGSISRCTRAPSRLSRRGLGAGRWAVSDIDATDGDEGADQLDGNREAQVHQRRPSARRPAASSRSTPGHGIIRATRRSPASPAAVGWPYGCPMDRTVTASASTRSAMRPVARPWRREFRLNETAAGDQRQVAVATLADGGFVAIWSSGVAGVDAGPGGPALRCRRRRRGGRVQRRRARSATRLLPPSGAPDGGLRVVWTSTLCRLSHLVTREFSPDGVPLSGACRSLTSLSAPPFMGPCDAVDRATVKVAGSPRRG